MSVATVYSALDGLEPHIAYRCWNIKEDGLYAPVRAAHWPPNQVIDAHCHRNGVDCDLQYCNCGLYAIDDNYDGDYPTFYFDLAAGTITRHDCGHIIGAVLMFKTSRKQERYFTARHAVVAGFRAPTDPFKCTNKRAEEIAATYGVPLANSHEELIQAAQNHPLMVAWHKQEAVEAY